MWQPPRAHWPASRGVRQILESAAHQTCDAIVRRLFGRVIGEQFLQIDPQHLHEVIEFKIHDELQARLDFGNTAPGNVPAGELQFRRQLGLGPLAGVTDSPHLRPDDVVIFQEFCAFQGAKLGGCFRENGSAYGASFRGHRGKIP